MARALTTADRVVLLLALVPYLREHGPTPVSELALAFGESEDAVRRLVAFLGTAGVPGETHTYQPEDLFDIDWDAFEQHDIVSLTHIVAVDDTPRFSPAEHAALVAGLHALREMLPPEERSGVERAAAKLALAQTARGGSSPEPAISITPDPGDPALAVLLDAMESGRRVSFEYRDLRGETTRRTVEPLELSQLGGAWYLRAHCLDRGAERTFLVDAMRGARAQDEAAEQRPAPGRGHGAGSSRIGPEAAEIAAVVRLGEAALHRIAAFSPRVIGPADDGGDSGWVRAEVRLGHPAAAIRLVQAAPGEVIVERPAEAREAVRDWAERALAPYGD